MGSRYSRLPGDRTPLSLTCRCSSRPAWRTARIARARSNAVPTYLVSKPVNENELIARISIHLEHRRLVQGLTQYQTRTSEGFPPLARAMQQDILPSAGQLRRIARQYGVDVAGLVEPCSEIGGDLWGVRGIDDRRVGLYDLISVGMASARRSTRSVSRP